MYTWNELSSFWDNILISIASPNALQKFSLKLIVFSNNKKNPDSFPYYAPRTYFFVENIISPGYLEDRFMDTVGPIPRVLEHCRNYFSVFLNFKLITDVVVMVLRRLERTKVTGASLGFATNILSALYKIFLASVLSSMYDRRAPTLAAVEEERKVLCNWEKLSDMREDATKKEGHFYFIVSAA